MGNEFSQDDIRRVLQEKKDQEGNDNNIGANNISEIMGNNQIDLNNKDDKEMENKIRNFLKCFICLTKVTKPRMCKYCSKICCESCINNWLTNHNYCYNCKKKITSEEMITLPFLDDMSKYFVYNIDSHPKNEQEESKNMLNNKNENKDEKKEEKMCAKHNSKVDYYCLQCRQYFCSNCLVFFGNEGKKHKDHLVLLLSQVEDLGMREAIEEYQKLFDTKNIVNNLIGMYKLKYDENEIKKDKILKIINNIKDQYISQIKENSEKLENLLKDLESQKKSIQKSIASITTTDDLNFEKLKILNKDYKNHETTIQEISEINQNLFIENYQTDFLELILPFSGQYFDDYEIINHKIDIIPYTKSRLIMRYFENNIFISFCVDVDLPLNAPGYPQFNTFIIFKQKKGELAPIALSDKSFQVQDNQKQQINSIAFDLDQFMNLAGEEKIIKVKLIIVKNYFK